MPHLLLPDRQCALEDCEATSGLLRCAACQVVHYCGRPHQLADRPAHKDDCNGAKKAKAKLEHEETKLRNMSLDLFENHVGRFWGIVETRDYMLARYSYVQALLQLKTHDAATVAAEHIREMLTLCRKDNLGVRDLLPCTWLRLGRDQDVYDFLKWWATTGRASDYDWGNMDLPHLDVKGADAFEPMDLPDRKHQSLAELMALLLIKVRLVLDLKQLRRAGTEDCKSGRVKLTSSIVEKIVEKELDTSTIEKLEGQVKQLTRRVWETNKYILPACEYPGRHLVAQPPYYSPGSEEEMESVLKYCWNAWEETPGAWEYLKGVAAETKP